MYIYFLIFILISYLFLRAYIKIKYKFWSIQPVFHLYNLSYWIFPPGTLNKTKPQINKYTNLKEIAFINYNQLENIDLFINFIQKYYLNTSEIIYKPTKNNIVPYFDNTKKSYFSIYKKDDEIVGVMTSRVLNVILGNIKFPTYYVDYLCVKTENRKSGIAQQIIQTHDYNQRTYTNISSSLFKRENQLNAIIPLVTYISFGYNMEKWNNIIILHNSLSLVSIKKLNIANFIKFISQNTKKFDACILPEINIILQLIESKNIYIYALYQGDTIMCIYIFRDASTTYNGKHTINLFASINNTISTEFIKGFYLCINILKNKYKNIIIENLSQNKIIIDDVNNKYKPFIKSPTAYYFYNFVTRPLLSNKVLIIN